MAQPSSPAERNHPFAAWASLLTLTAALLLQGAASRPAPPVLRWEIEGVIALLLLLAIGWRRPLALAVGRLPDEGWIRAGTVCLMILLWAPLLRGLWAGWPLADMLRDVIPLFFLFLPLVLVPALRRAGIWGVRLLAAALLLEGLAYCLRWWRHADWGFGAVGARALADGGGYFLNAPSVLFAAIGWPLLALVLLTRPQPSSPPPSWRARAPGWAGAAAAAVAGAICLAALLGAVHRMALGWVAVAAVVALWTRRRRVPWLLLGLIVPGLAAVGLMDDRLAGAFWQLAEKTRLAGANARWEEAAAALTLAGESLPALLLGHGWGALLENPAVGGWRVSYTHTFITYVLFKAGLAGVAAYAVWLGALAPAAAALWRRDPAWTLALLAPLLTALTVHTSFKYLDTGILLTLAVLWADSGDGNRVRDNT